jgi:hypothetical protein
VASLTTFINSCGHETSGWPTLYNNDSDFATSYQTLSTQKIVGNFHLENGFLYHQSHLFVPSSEHAKIIWEAHYNQEVRHFHVQKIVEVLQNHFYWLKLRQDVLNYIISCTSYTIFKPVVNKYCLCMSLPTLYRPWESISMDYMFSLALTKHGNDCVLVVVDRFSKMAIFSPFKNNIRSEATTKLLFTHVWVHFGIPCTIISDQYSRFLSTFCSTLWSMMDTKLTKLIAFHKQTDGQT